MSHSSSALSVLSIMVLILPTASSRGICGDDPAIIRANPLRVAREDDALSKKLKELYNHRLGVVVYYFTNVKLGREDTTGLVDSARRLVAVGLEVHRGKNDKIAFLNDVLGLAKKTLDFIPPNPMPNPKQIHERNNLRDLTLELEVELLRLKGDPAKGR